MDTFEERLERYKAAVIDFYGGTPKDPSAMRQARAAVLAYVEGVRWIPCQERMPEVLGRKYEVWNKYSEQPMICEYRIDEEYPEADDGYGHFVFGDCCYCEDISHWREIVGPLPEPPKE